MTPGALKTLGEVPAAQTPGRAASQSADPGRLAPQPPWPALLAKAPPLSQEPAGPAAPAEVTQSASAPHQLRPPWSGKSMAAAMKPWLASVAALVRSVSLLPFRPWPKTTITGHLKVVG